jgi:PAS domain S-box-containing protein
MLKNWSVKSKVLFTLLAVTVITALTVGLIAVGLGVSTLKEESYKNLTAVRELKANQIEHYFKTLIGQILIYSRGNDVEAAMSYFKTSIRKSPDPADSGSIQANFKNYAESYGFRDLFLVDNETGTVLYSVKKEIDTGTSLTRGVYSDTFLADAYHMAAASNDPGFTFQTDFEYLYPSNDVFTSFISTPVFFRDKKVGILICQIPINWINDIMTDNQDWGNMGLGQTGETFLAGEDYLLRNQSRFMAEDSADYFKKIHAAGLSSATISRMRSLKSSIGIQPVATEETKLAFRGKTGMGIFKDYRGVTVLAAYKPLKIKNLNWVLISKIDRSEVLSAIRLLFKKFLFYISLLFTSVIVFSVFFARDLSRPVEALARANEQLKIQSAAMKSAANGIIITDIHGVVKWVNPAFTRLTGYSFSEIVGNTLNLLNSGVQSKEFFKNMWSKISAGEIWHDEVVNKRKDGSLYTEEMTITPIKDSQKRIFQFVAIKQDITERKRLEQILKSAHERMEEELNVAKDIQMSMLPLKFPAFPEREDIDVFAKLVPAREVGGDFYDFYFIDEENFCFVVGDVSGKGVPAALFMTVTKALLKSGARNEKSTAKILTQVNNEISKDNENCMFITVFMAILNTTTGYLVYTNAGHNPSFVLRKGYHNIQRLSDLHGVVIGAMEGVKYSETVLHLNHGDSVFSYTDGITEAQDQGGNLYSEMRLVNLLMNYKFIGCKELVYEVEKDVIGYENGAEHVDDITLLSVLFREKSSDSADNYARQ